ncbi:hypothetical protein BpHYR1_033041 [Brachionus plicatilis]|uniref:Transmembrane protein n=1 Tax=Brachionus plicatilis TaxID=10195 RepID=A0A3M7P476_BRAPC|nr:hypothetical protein BpHYR1_033041 [Brachionus plicatilis]
MLLSALRIRLDEQIIFNFIIDTPKEKILFLKIFVRQSNFLCIIYLFIYEIYVTIQFLVDRSIVFCEYLVSKYFQFLKNLILQYFAILLKIK